MNDTRHDTQLVTSLEHVLERLDDAIDARLPLARRDRIEADRLFVFAGEVDAVLRAASNRLGRVRGELEGVARDPS